MVVLPPGTILQLMYLRERLRRLPPGTFVEVGPGTGEITNLLLQLGWRGSAYEISVPAAAALRTRFDKEIAAGRLEVVNRSYLEAAGSSEQSDLVISCMVMEHLTEGEQAAFMDSAARHLRRDGLMIGIVPASPEHWGVEDDIAGHQRRYTRSSLQAMAAVNAWGIRHVAGLTYPLSNVLLPLSNTLVARKELSKLRLDKLERTKQSGMREVAFKTRFPPYMRLFLNEVALWPLHALQKRLSGARNALVLYFEAQPQSAQQTQEKTAWTPS
jgi:SAM-dependent methyltransferase